MGNREFQTECDGGEARLEEDGDRPALVDGGEPGAVADGAQPVLVLGFRCPVHAPRLSWPHCCNLLEAAWLHDYKSLWPVVSLGMHHAEVVEGDPLLCWPLVQALCPSKFLCGWRVPPTFFGSFGYRGGVDADFITRVTVDGG